MDTFLARPDDGMPIALFSPRSSLRRRAENERRSRGKSKDTPPTTVREPIICPAMTKSCCANCESKQVPDEE